MKEYAIFRTGVLPTNTYVLFDSETKNCVVIDPAYDCSVVLKFIKDKEFNLLAILLTHGHFDHCGGVKLLTDYKKVKIFGSSKDVWMAKNASKNQWGVFAHDCDITDFVDNLEGFFVEDFYFKVIETPGHTEGSVCYLIDDFMFSGDTLFDGSVGRTDLPGGSGTEMIRSLAKISKLDCDYIVLPGHESTTTLSEQKSCNPYLRLEAFDYD